MCPPPASSASAVSTVSAYIQQQPSIITLCLRCALVPARLRLSLRAARLVNRPVRELTVLAAVPHSLASRALFEMSARGAADAARRAHARLCCGRSRRRSTLSLRGCLEELSHVMITVLETHCVSCASISNARIQLDASSQERSHHLQMAPSAAATCSGLMPLQPVVLCASVTAPRAISAVANSTWPMWAATCSGVAP